MVYVSWTDEIATGSTSPEILVCNLESGRVQACIKLDGENADLNNSYGP